MSHGNRKNKNEREENILVPLLMFCIPRVILHSLKKIFILLLL